MCCLMRVHYYPFLSLWLDYLFLNNSAYVTPKKFEYCLFKHHYANNFHILYDQ